MKSSVLIRMTFGSHIDTEFFHHKGHEGTEVEYDGLGRKVKRNFG